MNTDTVKIFVMNGASTSAKLDKLKLKCGDDAQLNHENLEDISNICRICATVTDLVIPVFDGEGIHNNLADKIHEHLPIKVSKQDVLPLVVCYQCSSTLLAWHELVQCCRQADHALRLSAAAKSWHNDKDKTNEDIKLPETKSDTNRAKRATKRETGIEHGGPVEESGSRDASSLRGVNSETSKETVSRDNEETTRAARRHRCHACARTFSDGGNLARHVRALHVGRRPHACALCRRAFTRKQHLDEHVRSHSERRDYVCDVCGKASKTGAGLRAHRLVHAEGFSFACGACDSAFKTRRQLRAHASVHTGERPHACACGAAFRLRAQLTRHERTHDRAARTATAD